MSADAGLSRIYLEPGELSVQFEAVEVSTILGSCIAVVLYSSSHMAGAICHAMLPYNHKNPGQVSRTDFKYVDSSIHYMVDCLEAHKIKRQQLIAKVFGGGDVLRAVAGIRAKTVGQQNIEAAFAVLDSYRLPVTAKDLGGEQGRKLIFYPHTGQVFLKRLNKSLRQI
ncbi:MAG: chemotaxis protein CheD [Pelovirga sp.]